MKKTEKKARVIEINTRIREMLATAKSENRQLTEAEVAAPAEEVAPAAADSTVAAPADSTAAVATEATPAE